MSPNGVALPQTKIYLPKSMCVVLCALCFMFCVQPLYTGLVFCALCFVICALCVVHHALCVVLCGLRLSLGIGLLYSLQYLHVMLTCLRTAAEIGFFRNTPFHDHSIESGAAFVGDTPFYRTFVQLETHLFRIPLFPRYKYCSETQFLETHLF